MLWIVLSAAIAHAAPATRTVPVPGPRATRTPIAAPSRTPTRTITATSTRTPSPNPIARAFERRNAEALADLRAKARWYSDPVIDTVVHRGRRRLRLTARSPVTGQVVVIERPCL